MSIDEQVGENKGRINKIEGDIEHIKKDGKSMLEKINNMKWYFVALGLMVIAAGLELEGTTMVNKLVALVF